VTAVTNAPAQTPPAGLLDDVLRVLQPAFRLDNLIALSSERALYHAWDRTLKRPLTIRVHLTADASGSGRAWFMRETETLAQLDHPTIRHVYAAGEIANFAYRTANWIEGESLADALRRGPRPIPQCMSLIRDLLSALEHAHARGIIMRRIVPSTLMISSSGQGVITDLRYSNWCLPYLPPPPLPADDPSAAYMAPEVRAGEAGDTASDVYTVAANIYAALTGSAPHTDPAQIVPARQQRQAIPAAVERVMARALSRIPKDRYYTATEMLEDFVADAGTFQSPAAAPAVTESGFERRLRRALGDDYELLEEIGAGGFGRVYRARDLALERDVAIKVLHPALTADPGVVERFRREAQLAARLRHPNIVSIYDIMGRAGLTWYTMEFVPGSSLAQVIQQHGTFSLDQTERLLNEALSALEHAHSMGLIHRDLKPENMLIEPDGRLRITDFGLALALRGAGGARFGGATSRSGTPQFAAPEQLSGERVDQRADLYSLSAVAYFALLGRPPFTGKTPEQILAKQAIDDVPALTAERRDVPRELEDALKRALRGDPAERFHSADAFHAAVRATFGGFLRRLAALFRPES
jgi:serine/threonine protein kinase